MGEFEINLEKLEAWIIDCKVLNRLDLLNLTILRVSAACSTRLEFDFNPRGTVRFYFLRYFLFFLNLLSHSFRFNARLIQLTIYTLRYVLKKMLFRVSSLYVTGGGKKISNVSLQPDNFSTTL